MVMVRSKEGCTVGLGRQSRGGAARWYLTQMQLGALIRACSTPWFFGVMGEQFYFLSGGKGSIGEVRFDWTVQVRLDPWTLLRWPDAQLNLLGREKLDFSCGKG